MRSVILLLAAAALLAVSVSAQAQCANYGSCDTCTVVYPCGWCTTTMSCQNGTASGSATCTSPYWIWLESQCQATPVPPTPPTPTYNCPLYDNCQQCTVLAGCGFCALSGTCVQGTAGGSLAGNCSGTNWAWLNNQCSVIPPPPPPPPTNPPTPTYYCPLSDNCAQCTVLPGCGFCALSNTCVPGTQTQSYWGNCSGSNWAWVNTQCSALPPSPTSPTPVPPTPTASCPNTFSCHKCTVLEGCEFCSTTGCISQGSSCSGTVVMNFTSCNSTGPTSAPTPAPWTPAPATCNPSLDCTQCTQLAGCGFCSYSGCLAGNATSSFNGCSGNYWSWTYNQCPTNPPANQCSVLTSCTYCTSQLGCGWCSGSSQCLVGNATGPVNGMCSSKWDFVIEQC